MTTHISTYWPDLILGKIDNLRHDDQGRCPHFAFLVKKGKILSAGTNNIRKTVPTAHKNGYPYPYRHAEIDSILSAPRFINFKKCTLVVIRVNKNGEILMSRPCKHCRNFIKKFNFKEVIYSTDEGFDKLVY